MGPLVSNAVQEFFQMGKILKQCNATSLVLLPKVQNPNNTSEFRPISYCTMIYKWVLPRGDQPKLRSICEREGATF